MSNVKDKLLFKPFKLIKHRIIDPFVQNIIADINSSS